MVSESRPINGCHLLCNPLFPWYQNPNPLSGPTRFSMYQKKTLANRIRFSPPGRHCPCVHCGMVRTSIARFGCDCDKHMANVPNAVLGFIKRIYQAIYPAWRCRFNSGSIRLGVAWNKPLRTMKYSTTHRGKHNKIYLMARNEEK